MLVHSPVSIKFVSLIKAASNLFRVTLDASISFLNKMETRLAIQSANFILRALARNVNV